MKGMRKISRGSDFGGVMAYVFDGELDNPREIKGELIGGNMSGRTPQELTDEFNLSKAIRPDVKRPVWHNSLRLPAGEKIDKETWNKIGDRYMEKMGFSEHHQRCYLFDDDPKGQHIHIPASRIGLDGNLFLGKNENLKSTKVIAELEIEFGLKLTKGVNYDQAGKIVMPDKSKVSKAEMEKALRTETEPPRVQLQKLVDQALTGKPTTTEFVERLQASGVDVVPNIASTGKLNGFSFGLDGPGGVFFSGSKLGDSYKYAQLEKRGLTYDQNRESGFLIELKTRARDAVGHDRAAKGAEGLQSGGPDRGRDSTAARDAENLRGVDRRADRASDRAPSADSEPSAGRVESAGNDVVSAERPAGSAEKGSEVRAEGTPKADAERPGTPGHALAPARSGSAPAGDPGAGIATGVEVSSAGLITTGDKGTDELLQAAHSGRLKAEREVLSRQKKQHAEDMTNAKKRQIELDKPSSNRLSWLADRSMDSTWRAKEIQAFARATGAGKFEITCSSSKPGEKSVKKVFTTEQLQNPATLKSMANMSARRFDVSIRPDPASGVILLKGLDADGIKKLEAVGLQPAAVIDIAGKKEAWIATGAKLSTDERTALTKRLETITGVEQKHGGAGGLVGFSSGQKSVGLVACPGQVAPAVGELLGEVKAVIFEAKATARLAKAIEKEVIVKARDFDDVGGIKSLHKGWLRSRCHAAEADATLLGGKYDAAQVERGVLEAMARQGVKPSQAYRAVFDDSRVAAGDERHAADSVAQAYTRVALAKEGKDLASVDLVAESANRHPDLIKRAESRQDSELKAIHEQSRKDAQADQRRLDAEAELQRIAKAQEAAEKVALERENGLGPKPR